jgi:hypothetical protein
MSKKDHVYGNLDNRFDTSIFDNTTDATYAFQAFAPRQEVLAAGSLAAAQALPIWYIERTTKVSPFVTDRASNAYDQVYDDAIAGAITTWETA